MHTGSGATPKAIEFTLHFTEKGASVSCMATGALQNLRVHRPCLVSIWIKRCLNPYRNLKITLRPHSRPTCMDTKVNTHYEYITKLFYRCYRRGPCDGLARTIISPAPLLQNTFVTVAILPIRCVLTFLVHVYLPAYPAHYSDYSQCGQVNLPCPLL